MPRVQTGPLNGPEQVQAQSQGVSTLHNPGIRPPAETNEFLRLAGALTGMQPELNRFLDNRMNEVTQADIAEGRAAALKNKTAFKEAVKTGKIPAGANPWFIQGYQEQEQLVNGVTFDQSIRQAWAGSEIRNIDNPEAFKSWMQTYTAKYIQENGIDQTPQFQVFMRSAMASQGNLASQHASYRMRDIEQKTIDGAQTLVNNVLDYPMVYDGAEGQIGAIKAIVNQHVQNGLNPTIANRMVVDSIVSKAKDNLSISDLRMIDEIDFGGGSLGKTQYAKEQIHIAEREIASQADAQNREHRIAEKQAKEEAADEIQRDAIDILSKNPSADTQELIQRGLKARVDPDKITRIWQIKNAALSDKNLIDENTSFAADLGWRSMNGQTTADEIYGAVASKQIRLETATRLQENLKDTRNSILRDPYIDQIISGVYRVYVTDNTTDQDTVAKGVAIRANLAAEAIKLAGENKSPLEVGILLQEKANVLRNMANNNGKTKDAPDTVSEQTRKNVNSIDANTRKTAKEAAPKKTADPTPAKPKEDAPVFRGYSAKEIDELYKKFKSK